MSRKIKRSNEYLGLVDDRLLDLDSSTKRAYFRSKLYERDNGMCGICGQLVDYWDMDIDHIVPKSLGGADHWDNLQITHPKCNRSKGNRFIG
jgi:5-methylcytosine-specific restriction endonuclease McrA